ncbi:MAG: type I 3-dehydroquinate dehydratase [Lachnospiraceae bacterium]|nr:type I 3-dehydroquinate dehydratase [Lachnospiraceae bacterium]
MKVRNIELGEGRPKICVPLTGKTQKELIEQLDKMDGKPFDLVEWRVDFFEGVFDENAVVPMIHEIRKSLKDTPLLFTFRTKWEGGQREISPEAYERLNALAAQTGEVDLIDVELFRLPQMGAQMQEVLKKYNVKMAGSNHDFEKTPPAQEITRRLTMMMENGADIPKIAVMPRSSRDVLNLLEATLTFHERYPEVPVITMAMGGLGVISRMSGEIFGSAVTFGSVAAASAPGQIPTEKLDDILQTLHLNLEHSHQI